MLQWRLTCASAAQLLQPTIFISVPKVCERLHMLIMSKASPSPMQTSPAHLLCQLCTRPWQVGHPTQLRTPGALA